MHASNNDAHCSEPRLDRRLDLYSCLHCGWTYRPSRGCPEAGLAPGADFAQVDPGFTCPKCGAPLKDFAIRDRDE
ncbi:rubredoxin [Desulfocurvus sp. DL9XJH121]